MDEIDDVVWKKVLALRDLSNPDNGATEAEAEVALAKMENLLLDHNLSLAMIDEGRVSTRSIGHEVFTTDDEAVAWEMALLKTLADHHFCRVIGDSSRRVFMIVGKTFNIRATWDTYLWLCPRLVEAGITARDAEQGKQMLMDRGWDWGDMSPYLALHEPARWLHSYLSGMVIGITESLKRSRWDALDGNDKRGLVPILDKEVDDYISDHFKVEQMKPFTTSDEEVFTRGKREGRYIDINKRDSINA